MKLADYEQVNEALFSGLNSNKTNECSFKKGQITEMLQELISLHVRSGWTGLEQVRLNLCGEKLCADADAIDVFKNGVFDFSEGLAKEQIHNADKTGLNYKMLPKSRWH